MSTLNRAANSLPTQGMLSFFGHSPRPKNTGDRILLGLALAIIIAGVVLTAVQYTSIKRSYFDDTFIYLNVAQNAIEFGTWQYFPNADRPALVASSPLRAIALTIAAAIAWPFTGGERSLASAALILPISSVVTALIFLPFWWRDKLRFVVLCAPYALLAASLDAINEFEAGLLYWWVVTVVRDFVARRSGLAAAFLVVLAPMIRPDVAVVALTALMLAHQSRRTLSWTLLREWMIAASVVAVIWIAMCAVFKVWPIPTTYWTKAALPKLFDSTYMISVFSDRIGLSALGAAPWANHTLVSTIGIAWTLLLVVIAARSEALRAWRFVVVLIVALLLMARTPANFWWYYQNALVAFVAVALALLYLAKSEATRSACLLLLVTVFACIVSSRALREPNIMWHFDKPSRAQGYLAMAKTFARDGTIELPGLGRGYLINPEIGITAYFGGGNAWIWDMGGLAQAHHDAMRSKLRYFYPRRLRELPETDIPRLDPTRSEIVLFSAWATEHRNPDYDTDGKCKPLLHEGAVCVSGVEKRALRK